MPYDYFLASRYRNKEKILPFIKRIRDAGKSVYCFIESEASVKHCGTVECEPEAAMKEFESIPDWRNSPRVREIFETDMQALKDCREVCAYGSGSGVRVGEAVGVGGGTEGNGEFGTEEEFLGSI